MADPTTDGNRARGLARVVSVAEATSFLLLLVATGVKYGADAPGGVRVLGPVHGALFIAYCVLVPYIAITHRWRPRRTLLALGASVLPVAPFFVERAWLRGASRPAPTAPPPATPPPTTLTTDGAKRGH
jgi:integral membrane protein